MRHNPLIVAEGYMDVIALSEAGFRATVAPLGTADDRASAAHAVAHFARAGHCVGWGQGRAARGDARVIDLALPLLEAGKGLRFAMMPAGQDPDDVIKRRWA